MRIIFHSSVISCHSGYGNVGYEIVKRLRDDGHFVRVATKHMFPGWQKYVNHPRLEGILRDTQANIKNKDSKEALVNLDEAFRELEGIEIFEGTNIAMINEMLEAESFDYLFSLWDVWLLHAKTQPTHDKWIAYIPVDTEKISDTLAEVLLGKDIKNSKAKRGPSTHLAMSMHGACEMNSIGILPKYAPHGINVSLFRPKPEGRKAFRSDFGFDDKTFLIGSVGLNYGDDRKGFIPLLRAFKVFHERHPEARLYIHSHAEGKYPGTLPYLKIINKLGIGEWVCWPHQSSNDLGRIDGEWLVDCYNGLDVYCSPTKGEGFSLTIPESAACGIPTMMTDTTTCAEFHHAGIVEWKIPVCDSDLRWLSNGVFRHEVGETVIVDALEKAHADWSGNDYGKIKEKSRKNAQKYSWDKVWDTWWKPFWLDMEERLKVDKKAKCDKK